MKEYLLQVWRWFVQSLALLFGWLWDTGDTWFSQPLVYVKTRRGAAWVFIAGLVLGLLFVPAVKWLLR